MYYENQIAHRKHSINGVYPYYISFFPSLRFCMNINVCSPLWYRCYMTYLDRRRLSIVIEGLELLIFLMLE